MDRAPEEAWFTSLADELERAVLDAGECARTCEELLEASRTIVELRRHLLLSALQPPVAMGSVLIDALDRPPELVLAAAGTCRETSLAAVDQLALLARPLETAAAAAALRRVAESCGRLL